MKPCNTSLARNGSTPVNPKKIDFLYLLMKFHFSLYNLKRKNLFQFLEASRFQVPNESLS